MHIIITGDPVGGFEFAGPFKDGKAAIAYGDRHEKSLWRSFWISEVRPADGAVEDPVRVQIELTREQGDMVRYLTWDGAKRTNDPQQIDRLIVLAHYVRAIMRTFSTPNMVFEFTRDDADLIRSLIYEAIKEGPDALPPETADLNELVDQFEQCMGDPR